MTIQTILDDTSEIPQEIPQSAAAVMIEGGGEGGSEGGRGGGARGAERGRNATSLHVDPEVRTSVKRDTCADLRGRAATSLGFNHRSGGERHIPGTGTYTHLRGDWERRAAALRLSSRATEALIRDTCSRQQHCASYVSRQAKQAKILKSPLFSTHSVFI